MSIAQKHLTSDLLSKSNHVSIYDPPFTLAFWPEMLEAMGAIARRGWSRPGQGHAQRVKLYHAIPVHCGEYDRQLFDKVSRSGSRYR